MTEFTKSNIKVLLEKRTEIHPTSNCWLWTGSKNHPNGHGEIRITSKHGYKKKFYVHRLSAWIYYDYDLFNDERQVNHIDSLCQFKYCWNPDHIYLGTAKTNSFDAIQSGKWTPGLYQTLKTHCPKGHEYTEENTYYHYERAAMPSM